MMPTSTRSVPRISYHYPCPDGIFSALAAHLKFSRDGQEVVWVPNAVYAPMQLDDLHLQVVPFAESNEQSIWLAVWVLAPLVLTTAKTHFNASASCFLLIIDVCPQAGQTLYMLDFAGPPGFATAAAQLGVRHVSHLLYSTQQLTSFKQIVVAVATASIIAISVTSCMELHVHHHTGIQGNCVGPSQDCARTAQHHRVSAPQLGGSN